MPVQFVRRLTDPQRTPRANRYLGITLAFVAGATNAGGYLAVKQYTSHMTGIVSAMADHLALGNYHLVWVGSGSVISFMSGAACSAIMINYARRKNMRSQFALPLLFEAFLLLCFGLLGAQLSAIEGLFVPVTVMLLCFIMGLQNAVISKLSNAQIRTTHVTGMLTDIGIELGKSLYWNQNPVEPRVVANRARLGVLSSLALAFFGGAILGAVGFKQLGYISTVWLALILVTLAGVPAWDDLIDFLRRMRQRPGNQ